MIKSLIIATFLLLFIAPWLLAYLTGSMIYVGIGIGFALWGLLIASKAIHDWRAQ